MLAAVAPHILAAALPSPARRLPPAEASAPRRDGGIPSSGSALSFAGSDGGEGGEELRCVIAVFRHGDRTPKQKMKLRLRDPAFLALYAQHRPRGVRAEQVKLKSAEALQGVLDACCDMLRRLEEGQDCGVPPEDCAEKVEKLRAVITVLSRKSSDSGHFSGINRKVQLKPLVVVAADAEGEEQRVTELQLVVKHGGVLTHAGRAQAEALGSEFRRTVYPPASRYDPDDACAEGAGLLRLHSTYRHDLKIWSSDEGRVQMSAAAFAKGLLDLEGTSLAPILVSLVNLNASMLDAFDKGASDDIKAAKAVMTRYMTSEATPPGTAAEEPPLTPPRSSETEERSPRAAPPSPGPEDVMAELSLAELCTGLSAPPVELLREMLVHIAALREEIQERIWAAHAGGSSNALGGSSPASSVRDASPGPPGGGAVAACSDESLFLLLERWRKLERGLYNARRGVFDISKVPDVFDAVKYDALHSRHWGLTNLRRLHGCAKQLADVVIPNEYGITPPQKLAIGGKICSTLLGKILRDFGAVRDEAAQAWREATMQRSSSTVSAMGRMSVSHGADDGGGGMSADEEDDGGYRLHAQYAEDVNSTSRHVRTRVYFTSESHLHALVNVIRFAHLAPPGEGGAAAPLVSAAGEAALARVSELDYLSTVVFRMFELKNADPKDANKFRLELLFSPGAAGDPFAAQDGSHALPVTPRVPLCADPPLPDAPLTLNRVETTLGDFALRIALCIHPRLTHPCCRRCLRSRLALQRLPRAGPPALRQRQQRAGLAGLGACLSMTFHLVDKTRCESGAAQRA
jgi:inositol hexakisphosphate/diphosphoinositol-pentakisphosphate kinase